MRGWLSKVWSVVLILCAFLLLPAYQNCGGQAPQSSQSSQVATITLPSAQVQKSNLDGCEFLLISTNTETGAIQKYVPLQINPSLLKDGQYISVTGTLVTDQVDSCMAGPLLQVNQAQTL